MLWFPDSQCMNVQMLMRLYYQSLFGKGAGHKSQWYIHASRAVALSDILCFCSCTSLAVAGYGKHMEW